MDDLSVIKNEDYENSHRFLSEEVLMPNLNKTDSNRSTMFCSHLAQSVIVKAESPLVYTNFENQVGKYSTMGFKKVNRNYKVIDKIYKNEFNYVMIVQDLETLMYTMFTRSECEWLTEHYGFKWDNEMIDSLEEDDIIEENDVLYKNDFYDKNMNFGYGVNLNAAYYTFKNLTLEDAVVISKTGKKKLATYSVNQVEITVNTNDLLLNLYGDDKEYKSFPDIGEHVKEQILACRKRINYNTAVYDLKNLKEISENDTPFFVEGQIVDIDIFSNIPKEELKEQAYNAQVAKYINQQDEFHKNVYKRLKKIVESGKNLISDELLYFYNNAKMKIDENVSYTYQNSKFSGFVIKFTILEEEPLNIGSKITGRYGNKGCISEVLGIDLDEDQKIIVLDDDEMPTVAEGPFKGLKADICLNPLGVFNRLNPSQLIEQELNFIAKHIRKYMEEAKTNKEKIEILLDFLKDVNSEEVDIMEQFMATLDEEQLTEFLNELIEKGIPICQKPFFGNVDLDGIEHLYNKYDEIEEFKCEGISTPLIIGEVYMMRLKHEPSSKFSARSTSFLNLRGLPAKSKSYKEHKDPYSNTPIRVGNMEISNLSLTNEMGSIMALLNSYSNNATNRRELIMELLTGNPFDIDVNLSKSESGTSKILQSLFNCLGLKIEDIQDELKKL